RSDDDLVGPARELDVSHRSFRCLVEEIAAYGSTRHSLERQRGHELLRAARHHDLNFGAVVHEAAHEVRTLVGGDPTRHAEQDLAGLRTHGGIMGATTRGIKPRRSRHYSQNGMRARGWQRPTTSV